MKLRSSDNHYTTAVSFIHMARFWNSLTAECFSLTFDLNGSKSSVYRHLLFLQGSCIVDL